MIDLCLSFQHWEFEKIYALELLSLGNEDELLSENEKSDGAQSDILKSKRS